jgi:hypothetical protein
VLQCDAWTLTTQEQRELKDTLRELGISSSPAADMIARVHASIASAMAADSHVLCVTSSLHPSRSLPGAKYNPLEFLDDPR